ncbi:MAG: M36 family metallopeptidase, partial [Acidobacteria bacterium]|nr:M36 family metallopeptidase [Acidobacteriota bacterium]
MRKFMNIGLSLLLTASSLVVATGARAVGADSDTTEFTPVRLERAEAGLPNFDARRDPESLVLNGVNVLGANKLAPVDRSVAIESLKASIPASYPDSIWIDVHENGAPKTIVNHEGFLTGPAVGSPETIARAYLFENRKALGLTARDVRNLALTVNDLDRNFGITYLKFQQMVKDVPVFDSEIGVTVTAQGEIAVVNTAQHIEGVRCSTTAALTAEEGIVRAFAECGVTIETASLVPSATKRDETSEFTYYESPLGLGHEDVMFQKTVVNVGGVARLAYRAYVDVNGLEWYDALVDANTGELIRRFNIVSDVQGQAFTNSPGVAGTGSRSLVQYAPAFGVTDPWLGSGTVSTGNNCDAYIDRDANNSADSTTTTSTGTNPGLTSGRADYSKGSPSGEFTFAYSSANAPTVQQANAVANLWYFNNYMHDWMYSLGFTESARNFQTNNFGRGGSQNDAVKAEAQDGSGTNNANFATPADGGAGRMQQYIFTAPTPDRDSDLDGDIVFHEYGHGVSNRLIGNGSGLGGTQSGAMGEGWGDYWACSNYNDGAMGEYAVQSAAGIRRAVYSVPANSQHDSYADVGNSGFEVHDDGEVWTAALWDLNRTIGKTKADMLVLNGMKNTASSPSFVTARSGIITACNTLYPADVCTVWTVFARHGLGASASGNDGTSHVAASDMPSSCGGSCSYSISPASASAGTAATTGSVSVTAGSGCSWTAASNASWLTVTSGASGSGNGTVGYSVAANSGAARTGTLTIAGQTFTVNQSGTSSATPIACGATASGSLATTDGRSTVRGATYYADVYSFTPSTSGTATITLNSSAFDCWLILKSSAGATTALAQDDDSNGGTNSKITYSVTAGTTYYVDATSYSANATG